MSRASASAFASTTVCQVHAEGYWHANHRARVPIPVESCQRLVNTDPVAPATLDRNRHSRGTRHEARGTRHEARGTRHEAGPRGLGS
ncbi:hypothetical protein E3T26_13625 [Cryobacterium sp. TMT1-21]|nr:hypothetical protein E3T26_13625 [Cryobacterium sp. TMT1-21]